MAVSLKFLPFIEECGSELDNDEQIWPQLDAGNMRLDKPAQ